MQERIEDRGERREERGEKKRKSSKYLSWVQSEARHSYRHECWQGTWGRYNNRSRGRLGEGEGMGGGE